MFDVTRLRLVRGFALVLLGTSILAHSVSAAPVLRVEGDEVTAGEIATITVFLDDDAAAPAGFSLQSFNVPLLTSGLGTAVPVAGDVTDAVFGAANIVVTPTMSPAFPLFSDVTVSQFAATAGDAVNTGATDALFSLSFATTAGDAGMTFPIQVNQASPLLELVTTDQGNLIVDGTFIATGNVVVNAVAIPEPGHLAMVGLIAAASVCVRRRR